MNIWRQAEEMLNTIQDDLHEDPPSWESAARTTEKVKALIPEPSKFQELAEDQKLQSADMRIGHFWNEVEHLEKGLLKQDTDLALRSAASALHYVQSLKRKEA
jgi:hypothetical protein